MSRARSSLQDLTPRFQTQLRNTAIEAAHLSGKVLMKHFQKKLKVSEKPGAGLVTNADLESQNQCVRALKKGTPSFGFLSEEDSPANQARSALEFEGRWIIDPLDGTTNYVHGFPWFCVSIAAEWRGQVIVGVIYHPVLEETYVAVRGQGAWVYERMGRRKRLQVSRTRKLSDSLLTTGFAYRKEEELLAEMEAFEVLSRSTRAIRRPGAAALDLAYTARGAFDGFWEMKLSPWDVAAGNLLVTEAGGKVTDFQGNRFSLEQGELVAANPAIHRQIVETLRT